MKIQIKSKQSWTNCLFIWLVICTCAISGQTPAIAAGEADSVAVADSTANLRGTEREARYAGDVWRAGLNAALYLPRLAVSTLLYSTGRGAYVATDPRVIERVEEFLYFYDNHLGWHPVLNLDSEFKPEYGAKLFYRYSSFGSALKGKYSDAKKWKAKAYLTFDCAGDHSWRTSLTAERTEDDDFVFYGIGSDPRKDARSSFQAGGDSDKAMYFQRRDKLQFIYGMLVNSQWDFYFTSFYQQREVQSLSDGVEQFDTVFDITRLPGAESDKKWRSIYSEIAVSYDSQERKAKSQEGVSVEGYVGYTSSFDDEYRFLRTGFDVAAHYAVLKNNRLIVPRIVFNMIENLNTSEAIPFFDYPHHQTFRGVSTRKLLRLDKLSFVPSLEYQWPLSHQFSGFLFSDALVVSRTLNDLTLNNAPWAVGIGMKMLRSNSENGRVQFAYGSQGIRIIFHLGSNADTNIRSEWR